MFHSNTQLNQQYTFGYTVVKYKIASRVYLNLGRRNWIRWFAWCSFFSPPVCAFQLAFPFPSTTKSGYKSNRGAESGNLTYTRQDTASKHAVWPRRFRGW